jgi:hypothetical protein
LSRVFRSFEANSEISFSFLPSNWSRSDSRKIAFYAVNLYGDVSSPQILKAGFRGQVIANIHESTGGAIAGVYGGSISFLIVVLLGVFCWRKRRYAAYSPDESAGYL